jgi:hypothetical protein
VVGHTRDQDDGACSTTTDQEPSSQETIHSYLPDDRLDVTGYITVRNGFVVSEVFKANRAGSHLGDGSSPVGIGNVTYSRIDSSAVAVPITVELNQSQSAGQSCTDTTEVG